ncbi:MAG TPA: NADH-quinone oxidoreductase subunit A [Gemmataceae bacterium]|nr:NADH-quinone oxidoreductase subunit A [Gemmataceae bacterium]
MPDLLAYVMLFTFIGAFFIFLHLMIGKLVRPKRPDAEKLTIYECGEPTIGSAWVQFDIRFYVVALLFVIFDVELAFFFPWAVVFGKANQLKTDLPPAQRAALSNEALPPSKPRQPLSAGTLADYERFDKLMTADPTNIAPEEAQKFLKDLARPGDLQKQIEQDRAIEVKKNQEIASGLSLMALADIAVFFGVLLVGFAYLWVRGDLDWVRSIAAERQAEAEAAQVEKMEEAGVT